MNDITSFELIIFPSENFNVFYKFEECIKNCFNFFNTYSRELDKSVNIKQNAEKAFNVNIKAIQNTFSICCSRALQMKKI